MQNIYETSSLWRRNKSRFQGGLDLGYTRFVSGDESRRSQGAVSCTKPCAFMRPC